LHLDAHQCILMHMRTTVDLDEAMLERAKQLALRERRTLSAVLGDALAAYLGRKRGRAADREFELLVRGRPGGRFPTQAEMNAVEEEEDAAALAIRGTRRRAAP
jgi:predicted transcriptional regulator